MAVVALHTYRDAIEHLRDWADALPTGAEDRRLHRAIQDAYEDLVQTFRWRFFLKHERINLDAPQTTGTLSYNWPTRTCTLSGATLPAWARYAHVLFAGDNTVYKVEEGSYADNSFTLEPSFCPKQDLPAGTSYKLFRSVYPLPPDTQGIAALEDERGQWRASYVPSLEEWLYRERQLSFSGRPFYWTVAGHPDLYGQQAIFLAGYPAEASTLDLIINRAPRRLTYDGFSYYSSQGSARLATAQAGTCVAAFNDLALPSDVVGAVLRLSISGATEPPSNFGPNRYSEQRIITSVEVASPAEVYVDSPWTVGKQGDHFTISDPLDLPRYMLPAFYRGAEHFLALSAIPSRVEETRRNYHFARMQARAVDGRMPQESGALIRDAGRSLIYGTLRISAME